MHSGGVGHAVHDAREEAGRPVEVDIALEALLGGEAERLGCVDLVLEAEALCVSPAGADRRAVRVRGSGLARD